MKKSHSLSILLLKDEITNPEEALKEVSGVNRCDVTIDGKVMPLFFKKTSPHPPSWKKLFQPHVGTELDALSNSGSAAVLLVEQSNRLFAVTFGYGKWILKPDCYEENFGLKVVLNSVDPEKLRSVDAQSLDAVPVHVRSQASTATNLSDFGVDIEQDLIYAATGQPKDTAFGKQITGKDSLKLVLPIEIAEFPELLAKLLVQSAATSYKENFAWIDNLSEVRDKGLVSKLDAALVDKIASKDFSRTWLSIPDIIEWSDFDGFKYQQPKQGKLLTDIDWDSYLTFVGESSPLKIETLKKHNVLCMSNASEQPTHDWPVYRCIYCELEVDGETFALNNGRWYRVDAAFLGKLDSIVKAIPSSTLDLQKYTDKNEADYNKRVHESNPDYFALMDRKMIVHGGGNSKIEFCDIYTKDKHLVHVKRYGGSSVLSHLFAQGLVSARLLLSDADFRGKVNEKLPPTHQLLNPDVKPVPGDFEVVYAVASNSVVADFELPLFSKINLRNCFNQLQTFGMKVSISIVAVEEVHD